MFIRDGKVSGSILHSAVIEQSTKRPRKTRAAKVSEAKVVEPEPVLRPPVEHEYRSSEESEVTPKPEDGKDDESSKVEEPVDK